MVVENSRQYPGHTKLGQSSLSLVFIMFTIFSFVVLHPDKKKKKKKSLR